MCGRYQIAMEDDIIEMREILDEINERYKNTPDTAAAKTGEIFPTDTAPVLIRGNDKPQAALMKWGFPKWQGSGVIINARGETAQDKLTFRSSLDSRRCIVPATGFFEWREENGSKTKYLFRLPETKILYLAGLYGAFKDGPRAYNAYVILTGGANSSMALYHNRMPMVLMPDDMEKWLSDTAFAYEYMQRSCQAMLQAIAV
jgi:putative SOS response-associated peptidase YedK